ncbi:MAG: lipolytic protein family [Mycobacterium sp.]|jgi:hypothetical protein|nr:lipolytic protein family [Mycobacterium sp.]
MSGLNLVAVTATGFGAAGAKFGSFGLTGGIYSAPDAIHEFSPYSAVLADATLEGWAKTTQTGVRVAFGKDALWWVGMAADGTALAHYGGNPDVTLASTAVINDGVLHHLALVISAGAGSLYVDGVRVATSATVASRASTNTAHKFLIGGFQSGSLGWGSGTGIDEVRVSNVARYSGASFTPPAAAFDNAATNTVALYHLENDAIDSATYVLPVEPSYATFAPNNAAFAYSPFNWDITASRALTPNAGAYCSIMITGGSSYALTFDMSNVPSFVSQISYRINGGAWTDAQIAAVVPIAKPTTPGQDGWTRHRLEFMVKSTTESANRWSSPYLTSVKFLGLRVYHTGTLPTVAPVTKSAFTLLVLGDSITEGINTLSNIGDAVERSHGRLGWAFLQREELGCEVGVVGFGRQGVATTGNGSVPVVGSTWKFIANGLARSFATPPSMVLINQGTNDKNTSVSVATFSAAYTALLNDIIATLPSSTVIVVQRPFGTTYTVAEYQAIIAATSAPSRVKFVDTTGWWASYESSDSLHPFGWVNEQNLAPRTANALRAFVTGAGGGRRFLNKGGVAVPV